MSVAYIAEYAELAKDELGNIVPVGKEPAIATQTVSFTTTTASAAFNKLTRFIRISVDTEAHFIVAGTPVATTSHPQIMADTVEYFGVEGGLKIALVNAA